MHRVSIIKPEIDIEGPKGPFQQGIVGNLLKKYGKGEFEQSGSKKYSIEQNISRNTSREIWERPDLSDEGAWYSSKEEAQAMLDKYIKDFDIDNPNMFRIFENNPRQPTMWFTDKTPSEFTMYSETAAMYDALKRAVAASGGGAKGVAAVAIKYGVPAAMIAKFLRSSDEERKKMMGLPLMAGVLGFRTGRPGQTKFGIENDTVRYVWPRKMLQHAKDWTAKEGGNLYSVDYNLKNPKILPYGGNTKMKSSALQEHPEIVRQLKSEGYDGVYGQNAMGDIVEVVIFKEDGIKILKEHDLAKRKSAKERNQK